jgi:hypothetical protein
LICQRYLFLSLILAICFSGFGIINERVCVTSDLDWTVRMVPMFDVKNF